MICDGCDSEYSEFDYIAPAGEVGLDGDYCPSCVNEWYDDDAVIRPLEGGDLSDLIPE